METTDLQKGDIEINFNSTKGRKDSDLPKAIKQHSKSVANCNDRSCIDRKCSSKVIDFEDIDGSFCKDCGYVFPF